jgi:hypothetical protein
VEREVPRAGGATKGVLRSEGGFALVGALLVMVLVTALGSAAVFLAQYDLMLAGNYRAQRVAEAAADGGLDLVKGMIYGNTLQLNLPLSIPSTDVAARAWQASAAYADQSIDVSVTVKYKQEDNVNYNTAEAYPDEVVRYGKDYNFEGATRAIGRQPVYTVTFADNKTGVKGEADLITTIGFTTPAALFCGGNVHMQKYQWATEESIEVTAGSGTPAVATAATSTGAITIETVRESSTFTGTTTLTAAAATGDSAIRVGSTANFPIPNPNLLTTVSVAIGKVLWGYNRILDATHFACTPPTAPAPNPCRAIPSLYPVGSTLPVGTFVNVTSKSTNPSYNAVNPTASNVYAVNPSYLHQRVYRPSEVDASKVAGLYNQAQKSVHILLGVGEPGANTDAAYAAAGGGAAGAAAAKALFRFYNPSADSAAGAYDVPVVFDNTVTPHVCNGIVCYNFQMPTAQAPLTQLETMFGQSFADIKSLADQQFTCNTPVTIPTGGTSNYGCNLKGANLGTATEPQVVYFNGSGTTTPISLVTCDNPPSTATCGQVTGFGILVIDGNADIVGSINWHGLMLIRGNLQFRPYQGGSAGTRSGADLATKWNGFIIIGGDLDLWTYWGGSIILGYSTSEVATIKGIISSTVPHKVLSWRRMYN